MTQNTKLNTIEVSKYVNIVNIIFNLSTKVVHLLIGVILIFLYIIYNIFIICIFQVHVLFFCGFNLQNTYPSLYIVYHL